MSTRIATFAAPSDADQSLLQAIAGASAELLDASGAQHLAVSFGPRDDELPLRWFRLWSDAPLSRADAVAILRNHVPTLVSVVQDDRRGNMLYERISAAGRLMVSTAGETDPADRALPDAQPFEHAIELGLAVDFPDEPPTTVVERSEAHHWWLLAQDALPFTPHPLEQPADLDPLVAPEVLDEELEGDPIAVEATAQGSLDALLDQAEAAARRDDHVTARTLYEAAVRAAPGDDLPWFCLATYAADQGDHERARIAFRHCVTLNPGEIFALHNTPSLAFLRGDPWFEALHDNQRRAQ